MKDSTKPVKLLTVFIAINSVVFFLLAILHFYWALGGLLWLEDVLPTNSTGTKKLEPTMVATFMVAFGLLLFAFVTIGNQGFWDKHISRKYFRHGTLVISIIFSARAIGDFKFIGFFKTITHTRFALNDTQFYSPLCLIIAVISLLIFCVSKKKRTKYK